MATEPPQVWRASHFALYSDHPIARCCILSGNTVFVGNRYETMRFDDKQNASEKFFNTETDDAWRITLLREHQIAYVFWGQSERELGAFDPARASYLQRVFGNNAAQVYWVRIPEP